MPRLTQFDAQDTQTAQNAAATSGSLRAELLENARQQDRNWREARARSVRGQIRWLDTLPRRSSHVVFWSVFCGLPFLLVLLDLAWGGVSSISLKRLLLMLPAVYLAAWAATSTWRAATSFAAELVRWVVVRRARNAGVEVAE